LAAEAANEEVREEMMSKRTWIARLLAVGAGAVAFATAATAQEDWAKVEAAAKQEGKVVFYNAQVGWPQPIAAAKGFEKKYGIRVDMLQGLRGAEVIERIRVEVTNKQNTADVAMMGATGLAPMAQLNVLADHGPLPNESKLAQKPWIPQEVPIFNVTYGIAVNTNLVPEGQRPKSWKDLTDPKWKGKILSDEMTVPSGGQSWFAVMLDAFGESYHQAMAKNDLQYDRSIVDKAKRVARGEFAYSIPFNLAELSDLKGLPVTGIIPEEGAPYTPISVAMITGGSNPNATKLFINYLLSPEGQLFFAKDGLSIATGGMEDLVPKELHWRVFGKLLGYADIDKQPARLKLAGEIYNRK
jgi:iron(III) transport system substrate-binding protein